MSCRKAAWLECESQEFSCCVSPKWVSQCLSITVPAALTINCTTHSGYYWCLRIIIIFFPLLRKSVPLSVAPHTKKLKNEKRKCPCGASLGLSSQWFTTTELHIYNILTAEEDIGRWSTLSWQDIRTALLISTVLTYNMYSGNCIDHHSWVILRLFVPSSLSWNYDATWEQFDTLPLWFVCCFMSLLGPFDLQNGVFFFQTSGMWTCNGCRGPSVLQPGNFLNIFCIFFVLFWCIIWFW